jgi:hypothetical protein
MTLARARVRSGELLVLFLRLQTAFSLRPNPPTLQRRVGHLPAASRLSTWPHATK